MTSEWRSVRLEECIDILTGFPFKSVDYTVSDTGVRLLRGDNVVQGALRWDGVKRWPAENCSQFEQYALKETDIVLAMDRPWIPAGLKFGRVRKADLPALLVQRVACLRPNDHVNGDFLYCVVGSQRFSGYIQNVATGTAVPHISSKQIKDFEFLLPGLRTQEQIGQLFATLDDRIALLRETNSTLEAIAQALFKSWFVDFDPVRAKAEGREPEGMGSEIAGFFPGGFEEGEPSLIPKGWRIGVVKDVAKQAKGTVNPLASPDAFFEHYSLPAFDSGQNPVHEYGAEIKSNKTPLPAETVLLSKLNPHIPRVWLPVQHGMNAVCSTEFLAFSPASEQSSKEFIYCFFFSPPFLQKLCQLVTGTSNSHQRVKPDQVSRINVVIPSDDVLKAFTSITRPLFERVFVYRQQIGILANLRDTLLPRLISGQLRLPDAEALLQNAA